MRVWEQLEYGLKQFWCEEKSIPFPDKLFSTNWVIFNRPRKVSYDQKIEVSADWRGSPGNFLRGWGILALRGNGFTNFHFRSLVQPGHHRFGGRSSLEHDEQKQEFASRGISGAFGILRFLQLHWFPGSHKFYCWCNLWCHPGSLAKPYLKTILKTRETITRLILEIEIFIEISTIMESNV